MESSSKCTADALSSSSCTMVSHKQLAMTHRAGTLLWSGLIGSLVLSLLATPAQAAG